MSPLTSGAISILSLLLWYLTGKVVPHHDRFHHMVHSTAPCQVDGGTIQFTGKDTICAGESTGKFFVEFYGKDPNLHKPVYTQFVINEIEVDHSGTDTAEFVEILGPADSSLAGYVLVFFNGTATAPPNASYRVIDLDRFRTERCGYFLLHGPGVIDLHPDTGISDSLIAVGGGFIQNGADAIALYHKPSFGNNTAPTLTDLVDAVVYHNSTGSLDSNLLAALGETEQLVDNQASSLARLPNGTGNFIKDSTPTPGYINSTAPLYSYLWLLSNQDSIIEVRTGQDTAGYIGSFQINDTGSYLVFGLSTTNSRDSFLNRSFNTLEELRLAINSGYCASLSNRGIPILARPPIRFLNALPTICSSFDAVGTYRIAVRWIGPLTQPFIGPGYSSPLPGRIQNHGDTIIFLSDPIPGGDTIQFQLRDPNCGNIWKQSISQFCDYCSRMHPPDSSALIGVCADDVFTIKPTGGGVEQVKPTADLFFSEYLEGSSNNKCLELFNGTGQSIDLQAENYSIELFYNGQDVPLGLILLEGVVPDGQTYVLCHPGADTVLTNRAQQTTANLDFNGDDALVLKQDDRIIDIIGQVGFDPGNQWGNGLLSTQDNTLIRSDQVFEGDTEGSDVFSLQPGWLGYATNEHDNLGVHDYRATHLVNTQYRFYDDHAGSIHDLLGIGLSYSARINLGNLLDTLYYSAVHTDYGCESETIPIVISSSPGQLTCLSKVNITLSEKDCTRTIHSNDVVKNPGHCSFIIQLVYPFGTKQYPSKDVLDRSHVGQPILYQAGRLNGNTCWGYVTVLDKNSFLSKCEKDTLHCYEFNARQTSTLNIIDPCSGVTGLIQNLEFIDSVCMSPFTGMWIRTKIISDFTSMSRICKDTIWIIKSNHNQLTAPESVRLDCDQLRGFTPELMIPDSMLHYQHYGLISNSYHLVPTLNGNRIYPTPGVGCNLMPSYLDLIMPLCGNGYMIRREWRITDWCTSLDTFFIQYISIEDFKAPRPSSLRPVLAANTEPHQCLGNIRRVRPLRFNDCSDLTTSMEYSYTDPNSPGKISHVKIENTPAIIATITLPVGKHKIIFKAVDACGYSATGMVEAVITDPSAPEAVCHGRVKLSVDPAHCWARVYAVDINNGSYDNCQSRLHLAVAVLDSIQYWRGYWSRELESILGIYKYTKSLKNINALIDHWVNVYVFRDFIDLGQGNNQVVLRVYESDSIPAMDPHRFPFQLHDWFCYNVYPLSRIEINYQYTTQESSLTRLPVHCSPDSLKRLYEPTDKFKPDTVLFEGSLSVTVCSYNPIDTTLDLSVLCDQARYNDCIAKVFVEDKFPPAAEQPADLNLFCDLADYRFATDVCSIDTPRSQSMVLDFDCRDLHQRPYREIEYILEHDNRLTDAVDPTGHTFGYYGCNPLDVLVLDEQGPHFQRCKEGSWRPVYCHRWLCQDQYDSPQRPQFNAGFWRPVFGLYTQIKKAGEVTFLISDNCQLDTSLIITDTSVISDCGTGWMARTWKANDLQGNRVEVTQKIIIGHRSDFEVVFPADTVILTKSINYSQIKSGYPVVSDTDCEITGISYLDQRVDLPQESGHKIVRTWMVRNWCLYNLYPGRDVSEDILVDDRIVADPVHRPCTYRHLKDGGDGQLRYVQIIYIRDKNTSAYSKQTVEVKPIGIEDSIHYGKVPVFSFQELDKQDKFQVFPNWPNPFNRKTCISYYLPEEGLVQLVARDLYGKMVLKKSIMGFHGMNFFHLGRQELPAEGIYLCSVQYSNNRQTLKLIVSGQ